MRHLITESEYSDEILRYEAGELNREQTCKLFSGLVKSGEAWILPGLGKAADNLIRLGWIDKAGNIVR